MNRVNPKHPIDPFISQDSMPSLWCPGCGIGTIVYTLVQALEDAGIGEEDVRVVSGIGCTGKIASHLNLESYEITKQDPIAFAAEVASKGKTTVVFTNDPDLMISGAKGLLDLKKGRRDLLLIHINNLVYTISESGAFPATPFQRVSADRKFELPYNIPHLAKSCGATYIARWTPLKAGWLKQSMIDAVEMKGLRVIEVVSPCVVYDVLNNRIGDGADRIAMVNEYSIVENSMQTDKLDLRLSSLIVLGKFVDENKEK